MTFDNGQMTLIHLVSFPSLWLPPPKTIKALIVGLEQQAMEELVAHCQNDFADYSFAFYYLSSMDLSQTDMIDWLIINQNHMDGSFIQVSDWSTLSLALSGKGLVRIGQEQASAEIQKLAEYAGKKCSSLNTFIFELTTYSRKV